MANKATPQKAPKGNKARTGAPYDAKPKKSEGGGKGKGPKPVVRVN